MFLFCKSKAASFLERGATSSGINLHVGSFLSGNFVDLCIVISVAWWTSIGISWSSIESPVAIEISSFLDCGCECGRLRCQKHHLLIEGAIEIVAEGKHLGNIINSGTADMLAPFLEPFIELAVPHFACVHLGNGLYLCLGWYELFLKGRFEISPWSVIGRCVHQGSGHEITCPFSGLCFLLKVGEGCGNLLICGCIDGLVNGAVVCCFYLFNFLCRGVALALMVVAARRTTLPPSLIRSYSLVRLIFAAVGRTFSLSLNPLTAGV